MADSTILNNLTKNMEAYLNNLTINNQKSTNNNNKSSGNNTNYYSRRNEFKD
jgi:hypothetical protein